MNSRNHDLESESIGRESKDDVVDTTGASSSESHPHDVVPQTRYRWRIVAIWSILLGASVTYMFIFPIAKSAIDAWQPVDQGPVLEELSLGESIRLRSSEFFVVFWIFAVGASFGSFLNVVAGRMNQGTSISGSSRCSSCNARIGRWDLIPILGWLTLGGRCRTCHVKISPRYPFVEALTAGIFLLLLFVELLSGCANIPFKRHYFHDGFVWIIFYPKWDVVGMYAYHMTLLCFLLVMSLIQWERARIPRRLVLTSLGLGALVAAISPTLQPVAWLKHYPDWLAHWSWLERIDTTLAGLVVGACLGTVLKTAMFSNTQTAKGQRRYAPETASMVLVGVYLGWQAALSIAVFTALFLICAVVVARRWPQITNMPASGWILVATILHICLWSSLTDWPLWPGPHSSVVSISMSCVGVVATCTLARLLSRNSRVANLVNVELGEGVPS